MFCTYFMLRRLVHLHVSDSVILYIPVINFVNFS